MGPGVIIEPMPTLRGPAFSRLSMVALGLQLAGSACGDAEREAALEARIAELERRGADTAKAIEPLADVPNALEQQQREVATLRDGQAAATSRLAAIDASIAALRESVVALERAPTAAGPIDPDKTGAAPPEAPIVEGAAAPVEVGIPECDAYLRKYVACIRDEMPEQSRPAMLDALFATSTAWRDAATGPARSGLATACKDVDASTREAMESLGCAW